MYGSFDLSALQSSSTSDGISKFWSSRVLLTILGAGASIGLARVCLSGPSTAQLPPTGFDNFLKQPKPKPKAKAKPQQQQTGFDSYLKLPQPAQDPNSFNAFLKNSPDAEASLDEAYQETATQVADPKGHQVVVTILFGTEYGFAKEISEKLFSTLCEDDKYWPQMIDMSDVSAGMDLTQETLLLLVCSTQGDGVAPSEARGFCDWLDSPEAPQLPCTSYSVCALGDTYCIHTPLKSIILFHKRSEGEITADLTTTSVPVLDARLGTLGARKFLPRQDVNREDWKVVDSWIQSVLSGMNKLSLSTVSELGGYVRADNSGGTCISKKRPFHGTIVATEGLCNLEQADDKDTIRVEIDLGDSGLSYSPGDALGIYASNAPEVVGDLLEVLGANSEEMHTLPSWHYESDHHPRGCQITLKDMLQHCYDLRSPRPDLLQLLLEEWQDDLEPLKIPLPKGKAVHQNGKMNGNMNGHVNGYSQHTNGRAPKPAVSSEQKEQLMKLIAASEAEMEEYLDPRHVVDVLLDFAGAKPPAEKLLRSLRPLQPRLYSISSSPLENPQHVQVTVAVVRYTSLARERQGVASTYLAERIKVGEKVHVYVSKNPDFRLPADPLTPIIMVGPGTGLAPFRSFIKERLLSDQPFGPSLLYFGCRRKDQDYLYGDLLEEWHKDGTIELFTAFSREQFWKVYVQDRLRESGKRVWELIQQGAHLYVCGDAANMAAAVEEAFLDVIGQYQGQGENKAVEFLEALSEKGRYQRDVWF